MERCDGRSDADLRPIEFVTDYVSHPEGSVLVCVGETKVLCNVTVEEGVPGWMRDQPGGGWITAEYSMLPRSTHTRTGRETNGRRGRTHEIQRLIGRSLRASVDLTRLGERTLIVDCDVIQADGGTRTASITGGYVALRLALRELIECGSVPESALLDSVAAVSVGLLKGVPALDLCYMEDSTADVDVNVVMTGSGDFIEVQGTAEGDPFSREKLDALLELARSGIETLTSLQMQVLAAAQG